MLHARTPALLGAGLLLVLSLQADPAYSRTFSLGPVTLLEHVTNGDPEYLRADDGVAVWALDVDSSETRIRAYDFANDELLTIRSGGRHHQPDVANRVVVWSDDGATRNINSYDLDTGAYQFLTFGDYYALPSIDGNTLAWEQYDGEMAVYYAQGPTWQAHPVVNEPGSYEGMPDVSNGRVVYAYANGIRVYDTAQQQLVYDRTTTVSYPDRAQITGDKIAWSDGGNIRIVNIETGQEWSIDGTRFFCLDGDVAVYYDWRSNPDRIIALDTIDGTTSVLREVPINSSGRGQIALDGNRLTWIEVVGDDHDDHHIYSAMIPEPVTLAMLGLGASGLLRRTPHRRCRGGRHRHAQVRGLGG